MNWKDIWMTLFGTADLFGLNMGFWVSMAVVALIVIVMNVVFWGMKPRKKVTDEGTKTQKRKIMPPLNDSLHP